MKTSLKPSPDLAKRALLAAVCGFAWAGPLTSQAQPLTVNPGWDLFATDANTTFAGVNWTGVPYATFNFGGSIGTQTVGPFVDTIIQRANGVTDGANSTIALNMVGFQLRTLSQVNLGAGLGYYYLSLDPNHASGGSMNITFDSGGTPSLHSGTFSSELTVYYDLWYGGIGTGSLLNNGSCSLGSGGIWRNTPPANIPSSMVVADVDYWLNGLNNNADFWPMGGAGSGADFIVETNLDINVVIQHVVEPIPEPSPLLLGGAGAAALILFRRWRDHK